jgi:DNA-binding transcriptional regulator YdaS (Cro superfamily)
MRKTKAQRASAIKRITQGYHMKPANPWNQLFREAFLVGNEKACKIAQSNAIQAISG